MSFWQENYQFIKEVYEMRHSKMAEWMENVEKVIDDESKESLLIFWFFRLFPASWLTKSILLLSSSVKETLSM